MTIQTSTTQSPTTPQPTGCCPPFDPQTYQEREIHWDNELFVKEHLHSVFHVPIKMASHVVRATQLIDAAGAKAAVPLMLGDEHSAWSSDLYIHVTKPVPGAEMATLSGTFLTRVYEGPFSDAPAWMKDMQAFVAAREKRLERMYLGYTTCPACAKAYGKNYVVVFARVS
jgi:hypothetical protein